MITDDWAMVFVILFWGGLLVLTVAKACST
jgi:hypothetical protein